MYSVGVRIVDDIVRRDDEIGTGKNMFSSLIRNEVSGHQGSRWLQTTISIVKNYMLTTHKPD